MNTLKSLTEKQIETLCQARLEKRFFDGQKKYRTITRFDVSSAETMRIFDPEKYTREMEREKRTLEAELELDAVKQGQTEPPLGVTVYGKARRVLGRYQADRSYMRLLLDGGQVYMFAVANGNPHYKKMLVEIPVEVLEKEDGNGDILVFADGTRAHTGGELLPFTKADSEYAAAMRSLTTATATKSEAARHSHRQAVSQTEAAALCNVTDRTIRGWDKGEGTPEGYPGRGDAVALRAWAARRGEQKKIRRGLKNMIHLPDPDKSTQKAQYENWKQARRETD